MKSRTPLRLVPSPANPHGCPKQGEEQRAAIAGLVAQVQAGWDRRLGLPVVASAPQPTREET